MDVRTLYNITVTQKIIAVNGYIFYLRWRILTEFATLYINLSRAAARHQIIATPAKFSR